MPEWRPLDAWRDGEALADGLRAAGVGPERRAAALWVPGRVEFFGKHTDYAGGRSLVAAVDRGLRLIVVPRDDGIVHWRDFGRRVEARFDLAVAGERPGHWSNYLLAPARSGSLGGGIFTRGVDVAMMSDLPAAAGLSSSTALVTAAYLALGAADEGTLAPSTDRLRLADYLGAVEAGAEFEGGSTGEGVGTRGGRQDHAAVLCSRRGQVSEFSFAPLRLERRVAMPANWRLVVAVSGVHAKKTGGSRDAFNLLSRLTAEALDACRECGSGDPRSLGEAVRQGGGWAKLRRAVEARLAATPNGRAEALVRRLEHFVLESEEIVPAAANAVLAADAGQLGRLASRSQAAAEALLGNQVAETSALARIGAREGALAASAFGAGFGGAVWALVEAGQTDEFLRRWRSAYTADFPQHAEVSRFFGCVIGGAAAWEGSRRVPPEREGTA